MQAFYSRQYATFFDTQHTTNVGSRFTAAIQNGGTFMKIKNVAIKNFRGYSDEINSDFEDLTAFVGKNDIGKSTILEALDIFFNDGKGKRVKKQISQSGSALQIFLKRLLSTQQMRHHLAQSICLIRTACLKLSNVILMQVHQKFLFVRCIRRIRNVQTYLLKR